ncbi:MAG: hypothetical protein ACRD2G_05855, partial [Terriglobia bacterium]
PSGVRKLVCAFVRRKQAFGVLFGRGLSLCDNAGKGAVAAAGTPQLPQGQTADPARQKPTAHSVRAFPGAAAPDLGVDLPLELLQAARRLPSGVRGPVDCCAAA